MRRFLPILLVALAPQAIASDAFIEGFPDVPLVAGVTEDADSRTVFDTPSGTVAQTTLVADRPAASVLKDYSGDLPALGWTCTHKGATLRCERESDILTFDAAAEGTAGARIILRLEPRQ